MSTALTKSINTILKKNKNIILAYVFGSVSKGEKDKCRDVDVAVLLKNEKHGLKKLELINSLTDSLEKKLNRPVDIVILNHASIALRQQIIKYGLLLFEAKKGLHSRFFVDTITKYFDYLNILRFFYKKTVKCRG